MARLQLLFAACMMMTFPLALLPAHAQLDAAGDGGLLIEGNHWLAGDGIPGVDGVITALALGPDGSLYVGGDFALAGETAASRIAHWVPDYPDGGAWLSLVDGLDGPVLAIAVSGDGAVYAGGQFENAGGISTGHIARWTPGGDSAGEWSPLGDGVDGPVDALALAPDGSLYVGGRFSHAGGVAANGIARWSPDGAWSALGSGLSGGPAIPGVRALAIGSDGDLFVGGSFTHADGQPAANIARWSSATATWNTLAGGLDNPVLALALAPDGSLYAGGMFASADGESASRVARWSADGAGLGQWESLGEGVNNRVHALALGPDGSLFVGGRFTSAGGAAASRIAKWTPEGGGSWEEVGGGVSAGSVDDEAVHALAVSTDGLLYAGGDFGVTGDGPALSIAGWQANASHGEWQTLGSGFDNWVGALAHAPDGSIYAAGAFRHAGEVAAGAAARWLPEAGGGTWDALGDGVTPTRIDAVAVAPDGSVYVGGPFAHAGGDPANKVAQWIPDDHGGGSWSALGEGVNGQVNALSVAPDGSVYVGGNFSQAGGQPAANVARWIPDENRGGTWTTLGEGVDDAVHALAIGPDGAVYAGGRFTSAGGEVAGRVARWMPDPDGTGTWSALGAGTGPYVETLVVTPESRLYVGGWFTEIGGQTAGYIAEFDPASEAWYPLGDGLNAPVSALALASNGTLYVGGRFTEAGALPASRVARWTPHAPGIGTWAPVGEGTDDTVYALALDSEDVLYAGGTFTHAGGEVSAHFARWDGHGTVSAEPLPAESPMMLHPNYPNPFASGTTITFDLPLATPVRLAVFDLLGREVAVLIDGELPAGSHEAYWQAAGLSSGLYVARIEAGGAVESIGVTLVR